MKVAVYDTYVTKKNGETMHFDIVVPSEEKNENTIFNYGKEYLKIMGQEGQPLTARESSFCHLETAKPLIEESIRKQGYHIIEMEGC